MLNYFNIPMHYKKEHKWDEWAEMPVYENSDLVLLKSGKQVTIKKIILNRKFEQDKFVDENNKTHSISDIAKVLHNNQRNISGLLKAEHKFNRRDYTYLRGRHY